MMKSKLRYVFLLSWVAACLNSCKPDLNELTFNNNGVDFSKYVAVGSSFAAGYMNGALYGEGQENSFPNILSKQFKYVGGGEFTQPLFNSSTGFGSTGKSKLILDYKTNCRGENLVSPVNVSPTGDAGITDYIGNQAPFNNMGVPGMRSFHFTSQNFGSPNPNIGNPYYARFATSPENSTVLTDALRQLPTFFTFWVGTDDVLGYAMAGGQDVITADSTFKNNIRSSLASLSENNTKGIIANIPDITDLPFFTTIPYNALELTQAEADALDSTYSTNVPPVSFTEGYNAFVIEDASSASGKRQMTGDELVLLTLPLDSVYCAGFGSNSLKTLKNKYVLTKSELAKIKNATGTFNSFLKSQADSLGLAFVDMNAFFKSLPAGITFNGVNLNAEFVSGGIFSLDGITTNAKGSALVANEFIKAINNYYGCRIPLADINAYPGITFP